jgi:hypothetical protein
MTGIDRTVSGRSMQFGLAVRCGHAAVDRQVDPGDEPGVVTGQEGDRGGDVLRLADAPERNPRPQRG